MKDLSGDNEYLPTNEEHMQVWYDTRVMVYYARYADACCPFAVGSLPMSSVRIDHEHVKGYKKMKVDDRRKYIRGLVCTTIIGVK
jgi:hypothetical protein